MLGAYAGPRRRPRPWSEIRTSVEQDPVGPLSPVSFFVPLPDGLPFTNPSGRNNHSRNSVQTLKWDGARTSEAVTASYKEASLREKAKRTFDQRHRFYEAMLSNESYEAYLAAVGDNRAHSAVVRKSLCASQWLIDDPGPASTSSV